jgi:hypothetical protein
VTAQNPEQLFWGRLLVICWLRHWTTLATSSTFCMSKVDQNESRSKQDLTNLYKQLEKLRQTALPNAPVSNSQTPASVLQALLTIDFPIKNVGDQVSSGCIERSVLPLTNCCVL